MTPNPQLTAVLLKMEEDMKALRKREEELKLLQLLELLLKDQDNRASKSTETRATPNAPPSAAKRLNKQWKHRHLKGGRTPSRYSSDYNVLSHTFIDGRTKVWCAGCGWTAWSDGPAYVWAMAQRMVRNSTNCSSSSETLGRIPRGPLGGPEILNDRQHRPYTYPAPLPWSDEKDNRYLPIPEGKDEYDLNHIRGLDGLTKQMHEYCEAEVEKKFKEKQDELAKNSLGLDI